MIETNGIDKGVMQISNLITQLKSIQTQLGDMKVCVNGLYIYDFEDSIEIDQDENCINFRDL